MQKVTFITGNQNKADYLSKCLGMDIDHIGVDLDEIQSLDLQEIIQHKVREAYKKTNKPVIVDDVSLEIVSLGQLPGPFVKFFVEQMSLEDMCKLPNDDSRLAIAKSGIGYFDGKVEKYFEREVEGAISNEPRGGGGFGWDKIFIAEGLDVTNAELSEEDYQNKFYLKIKPFDELKKFLKSL